MEVLLTVLPVLLWLVPRDMFIAWIQETFTRCYHTITKLESQDKDKIIWRLEWKAISERRETREKMELMREHLQHKRDEITQKDRIIDELEAKLIVERQKRQRRHTGSYHEVDRI